MIERVGGQGIRPNQPAQRGTGTTNFDALFRNELAKQQLAARQTAPQQPVQSVNFSKHAISRVEERGIEVTPLLMERLAGSVSKAQEKGATNILAMDGSKAFIINVPTAKVITAITQAEMKDNVFTNIDGAVFL